jgi:acyl-CoA dehydrogenase
VLDALRRLLTDPPATAATLADWQSAHEDLTRGLALPFDRAVVAASAAPLLGFAFASGYRCALEALIGGGAPFEGRMPSLCVTERGGNHPRAIETTLTARAEGGYALTGRKRWTTMASRDRGALFVAASVGADAEGRNRLRLVRVASESPGVTVTPMAETPFIPEIPHAEVSFDGVRVREEDVLPGDGYDRYVKPFRTVEDIHVHGAALAYLAGVGRRAGWPRELGEEILAALASLRSLAEEDPSAPELHLALGGAIRIGRRIVDATEGAWAKTEEGPRRAWERDRALLLVAEKARAQRLESAYRSLGPRGDRATGA